LIFFYKRSNKKHVAKINQLWSSTKSSAKKFS
jgi:hypothetical protein